MSIMVPSTLKQLKRKEQSGNPVVIAGYGHESTHAGYLSWILDSTKWSGAGKCLELMLQKACSKDGSNSPQSIGPIAQCHCEREVSFGNRRKVDLLVTAKLESGETRKVPLELKTDSAGTKEQFTTMGKYASSEDVYQYPMVFLLGASSVFTDRPWHDKFTPLTVEDLLCGVFGKLPNDTPPFVQHYTEALATELGRKRLAIDCHRHGEQEPQFGYRNKLKMFYILNYARLILERAEIGLWELKDGGYNTVLNLNESDDSWQPCSGVPDMQWYFEFNDKKLCMKVYLGENETKVAPGRALEWIQRRQGEIRDLWGERLPKLAERKPNCTKTWVSVCNWTIDFSTDDSILDGVRTVIGEIGAQGLLGSLART